MLIALTLLAGSRVGATGEPVQWVKEPALTFDEKEGHWWATFELSALTDVEVSIVDRKSGVVVRHLAAGVLGPNAPPPLAPNSPAQRIAWDGKDDYGSNLPQPAALVARVRAGMSVALKRIAGGDPYAFYSRDMAQGDHAKWKMTGLEAKADGTVYVMGNSTYIGPPVLRQYDAAGAYLRTVFPPPAGKPVKAMKGWGLNVKSDGTYSFRYNDLSSTGLSTTLISDKRGQLATVFPSPEAERLTLWYPDGAGFKAMTIGKDGTLQEYEPAPLIAGPMTKEPLCGPVFSCFATDGKSFYLSGVYEGIYEKGRRVGVATAGPWRDGQVYKVDLATRAAEILFSLVNVDGNPKDRESSIGSGLHGYAALHGVAVDKEGRVFVCDRQNQRVLVLDGAGKMLRHLPLEFPDAIAVHPTGKALYVVTRNARYRRGELKLVKFSDWSKDAQPAVSIALPSVEGEQYPNYSRSWVALCETDSGTNVWVAYHDLPVQIYRDVEGKLQLIKDFYQAGPQRCLDFQRIAVDQVTEDVYVADGFASCFRLSDWNKPTFVRCMENDKQALRASDIQIDSRNRMIYVGHEESHGHGPIARYRIGGPYFEPAPLGGSHALTPPVCNNWAIGMGYADRGFAVAPDGSLAVLGGLNRNDTSGDLHFFKSGSKPPWPALRFDSFGAKARAGGARFDLSGNLYVGKVDGKARTVPVGFESDAAYAACMGRIYKYAPTGSVERGDLFPTAPSAPAKVYDVDFGAISSGFCRTPRFGVDGFGRIYYPTTLSQQVTVMDNAGNVILRFGTWGNRDSMGGLPGDLVPTRDVPMAYPNSVDATDQYIYVGDIVNVRLLQIAKRFALTGVSR